MLATAAVAAVAGAQPGPQDGDPSPQPAPQPQPAPAQGGDDSGISPPGMTQPVDPYGGAPQQGPDLDGAGGQPYYGPDQGQINGEIRCEEPQTWPIQNQESGVPPAYCEAVPVCDPVYDYCGPNFYFHAGPFGWYHRRVIRPIYHPIGRGPVVRGGFGHYFGTGGG